MIPARIFLGYYGTTISLLNFDAYNAECCDNTVIMNVSDDTNVMAFLKWIGNIPVLEMYSKRVIGDQWPEELTWNYHSWQ